MTINANEETQALIVDVLHKFDYEKEISSISSLVRNICRWLQQLHKINAEQAQKIISLEKIITKIKTQPVQELTQETAHKTQPVQEPTQQLAHTEKKQTSYLNLLGF